MAFDAHKNFAYSTVATAPSPATSGTSLVVSSGDGAKFPLIPFNATVWPVGVQPTTANAEIIRVTGISTDTFSTIVRAQEGTSARSIQVGDQISANITAKVLQDVETIGYLGYAQRTTTFTTSSTSATQITSLSATVTIPALSAYRAIKITGFGRDIFSGTGLSIVDFTIWRGTVGSGTQIGGSEPNFSGNLSTGSAFPAFVMAVDTSPGTGSVTYNLALQTSNGVDSANLEATSTAPAFILVEVI